MTKHGLTPQGYIFLVNWLTSTILLTGVTPKSPPLQKACSQKGLFKKASCQKGYPAKRPMKKGLYNLGSPQKGPLIKKGLVYLF